MAGVRGIGSGTPPPAQVRARQKAATTTDPERPVDAVTEVVREDAHRAGESSTHGELGDQMEARERGAASRPARDTTEKAGAISEATTRKARLVRKATLAQTAPPGAHPPSNRSTVQEIEARVERTAQAEEEKEQRQEDTKAARVSRAYSRTAQVSSSVKLKV